MISNIKTVTLRLSQKEFNFLMNGINTKFFMDIMYDLEKNGLIKYSLSENEFAVEPCITSFVSTDDVVHKGTNCDTHLDELCFEMMTKKQISEAIARYDSMITLHFPMVTLKAFSLKKDENENTYESIKGVVVNP